MQNYPACKELTIHMDYSSILALATHKALLCLSLCQPFLDIWIVSNMNLIKI